MSILFTAGDIFEIAIRIEQNGARFYRKAAALARSADMRRELNDLAAMEDRHEATFTDLMRRLVEDAPATEWFEPDGDPARYLQSFTEGQVFDLTKAPADLTPETTLENVLKLALQRERDSIVFYLGVKDLMPQTAERAKIETIVKEEMGHIAQLTQRLIEVTG